MRGPIVWRQTLTLGHYADLTGTGTRSLVRFTRDVAWAPRTQTRISYLHGGRVLKHGTTTCDAAGLASSIGYAAEMAREAAATYDITPDSSLHLVARTDAELVPLIEDPQNQAALIEPPPEWVRIDNTGRDGGWLSAETALAATVWSSRNTPADNHTLAATARRTIDAIARNGAP